MKIKIILFMFLMVTFCWSQKLEKIRGTRIVTIENKEIGDFHTIEVYNNLEVFLERGEKPEMKIEADENLQSIVVVDLDSNILKLKTSKAAVSFKKLIVRITYTDDLRMVIAQNNSTVNAIQEIQLNSISFKSQNESKLNLNVSVNDFLLQADEKSKVELNLKAQKATVEMSKNAYLKALIASVDLKCDMYQKTKTILEGDIDYTKIRLDNNANFMGQKLNIKNCELTAESYTNCEIHCDSFLNIDASGNSEIRIFGEQKIEIKRFIDSASLIKKPSK